MGDAETIHALQIKSFMPLLDRYQDFETNPANEPIEKIIGRINQSFTDFYLIKSDGVNVGGIRIVKMDDNRYRVSPIFILPEYREKVLHKKSFKWLNIYIVMQRRGN